MAALLAADSLLLLCPASPNVFASSSTVPSWSGAYNDCACLEMVRVTL